MKALLDNMFEKGTPPSLVRTYKLGESDKPPLVGWWNGYSETEKELKLTLLELCAAVQDINERIDLQPRQCCVNCNSGVVTEFVEWDSCRADKFKKFMEESYNEEIKARAELKAVFQKKKNQKRTVLNKNG